jgi:DNA-binding transcriptional ArsR family regulator
MLSRALSHPTRRRILRIMRERKASPSEIADEMAEPIGRVSHHVRWLAARGYIELVGTAPRRGAVEHYYRAAADPLLTDEQWEKLPPARRAALAEVMLRDLWGDVLDARDAKRLTAPDVHLTRTLLTLDERGHRELSELLLDVVVRALDIEAASKERLGTKTGRETELGILHFEHATGTPPARRPRQPSP